MDRIGAVIAGIGVLCLIVGLLLRRRSRVRHAPTGSLGTFPKQRWVSVEGNVFCPEPLVSPLSGATCLFYRVTCTARWKEGDVERALVVDVNEGAARFSLDDGSGRAVIDARAGADFEPQRGLSMTKAGPPDRVQVGGVPLGATFTLDEEILPWVPRLFARGGVVDVGLGPHPKSRLFLSSPSSRGRLVDPSRGGRMLFVPGAFASAFGLGLAIAGCFISRDSAAGVQKPAAVVAPIAKVAPPIASIAPAASVRVEPLPKAVAKPIRAGKPAPRSKPRKAPETG